MQQEGQEKILLLFFGKKLYDGKTTQTNKSSKTFWNKFTKQKPANKI